MSTRTLALALLLLAGCEEIEPFVPTVSFQQFELQDIDFQHVEADFEFSVDNPNPVEVQLSSFSYALGFAGVELLSGDDEEGFSLEPVGSSALVLPVDMAWEDAWSAVQATRGSDEIDFGLAGHFGFETPLGEARIPYDEDGRFPALRTPGFALENLRVSQLDLVAGTAQVELDVAVDNAHASTLFFQDVAYDLSLEGRPVGSGTVASLGGVEGATEERLSLPMELDLVQAGSGIWDVLSSGGRLDAGLDATMNVDTPFGLLPLAVDETGEVKVSR